MQSLDLAALRTHSWHIQACSAQTGQGISEGFEWLIQDVAFRLYGTSNLLNKTDAQDGQKPEANYESV